jgi:hypothetical protein
LLKLLLEDVLLRYKIIPFLLFLLSFAATLGAQTSKIPLTCADTSGSGTAQVCSTTLLLAPTKYDSILYSTTTTNTGDVTLNVDSTGAAHIKKWSNNAVLAAGDLVANIPVLLVYDGVAWELGVIGNPPLVGGGVVYLNSSTKHDAQQNTGASITSAGSAVTCTNCTFTSGDVGKSITLGLFGVGPGSAGALLVSTISAFTDSHHVTIAGTAGTTNLTGNNILWGTADSTAINAAITSLAATGGTLYVGCGDSYLDAQISAAVNVNIIGLGPIANTSAPNSDCTGWWPAGNTAVSLLLGNTSAQQFGNTIIQNIGFTDFFSQTNAVGIEITGVSGTVLRGNMLRGYNGTGATGLLTTYSGTPTQASNINLDHDYWYDLTIGVDSSKVNVDGPRMNGGEFNTKNSNTNFTGQPIGMKASAVLMDGTTHFIVNQNAGATQNAIGYQCVNSGTGGYVAGKFEGQSAGIGIGVDCAASSSRTNGNIECEKLAACLQFESGTGNNYFTIADSSSNNTQLVNDLNTTSSSNHVHTQSFDVGPHSTVGGLPSTTLTPDKATVIITNGANSSDCTTGSGSTAVLCYLNAGTWTALVSSGGNTTSTSGTSGFYSKFNGANSIINGTCDSGITTANTFTCSDSAGGAFGSNLSTTADGVHPSGFQLAGNTTLSTLTVNTVTIFGPPSATPTAWSLQVPTAIPATGSILACVTTSTNCLLAPATGANVIALWTGTCSSSTFLRGDGACATAGGSAPSLDQVTGSAAQATATETAIGHGVTEAGVETTAATYPYIFRNTNATNTTTGAMVVDSAGAGNAQKTFVIEQETLAGDALEVCTGGSLVANVLTCGTIHLAFNANSDNLTVGATGATLIAGGSNSNMTIQGSASGSGGSVILKGTGTTATPVVSNIPTSATEDIHDFEVNGVVQSGIGPTGIVGNPGIQTVTGADYTNATVTPSTVFSFTLPHTDAAKTYKYSCDIMWESTAATLVGPVFGVNISAAPTQLTAAAAVQGALTGTDVNGYLSNTTTGSQTLVTSGAAAVTSTNYWAKIWGTIEGSPTAGATFIINAASTSGTTASLVIRRGSSCSLEAIK